MKKKTLYLMAICLSLTFSPALLSAGTTPASSSVAISDSAAARSLLVRLNEINTMDKSNLSSSEKKELKKEVKSINHGLKALNGGIYLSVGAVIIILLLLILL